MLVQFLIFIIKITINKFFKQKNVCRQFDFHDIKLLSEQQMTIQRKRYRTKNEYKKKWTAMNCFFFIEFFLYLQYLLIWCTNPFYQVLTSILIFCFYHVHAWFKLWWKQFITFDFQIGIPFSSHNFLFKHCIQDLIFFKTGCRFQIMKYLIRIFFKSDVDFIQYFRSVLDWHIHDFKYFNHVLNFWIVFFLIFFFCWEWNTLKKQIDHQIQKIFWINEIFNSFITINWLMIWINDKIYVSCWCIIINVNQIPNTMHQNCSLSFFFVESLFNKRFFDFHFHNCWKQLKIVN